MLTLSYLQGRLPPAARGAVYGGSHGGFPAAWLLGALDNPYAPSTLDVRFTFNRLVFWGDLMELWVEEGAKPGAVRYWALNADGRMTAEMTVVDVSYD